MNKIRNVMLGHDVDNISVVVITPLPSTYKKIKIKLNIIDEFVNCFFENCIFEINQKKGLLVLAPQGIASKDIVELFENTSILFFGLAGSLNPKIKIGELVEVEKAITEQTEENILKLFNHYKNVKCGYSPCLLGNIAKNHCEFAKDNKCDVVDMETSYCAKVAKEKNNQFSSLLLISDIPEVTNFWEISIENQEEIKKKKNIAIDEIISNIEILLGGNNNE